MSDSPDTPRETGFNGADTAQPRGAGLADAGWSPAEDPRAALEDLVQHRDGSALRGPQPWLALVGRSTLCTRVWEAA